jgi:Putative mono-oxygenase ydhR
MHPAVLAGTLIARQQFQGGANEMVVHFVRITTRLAHEEVRQIMEERAPRFREVPGLLQKYYGYEPSSEAFCGCYIFDSEESRQAFRQSELARSIPAAYQAEEVRVEAYEVLFPLHEMPQPVGQAQYTR